MASSAGSGFQLKIVVAGELAWIQRDPHPGDPLSCLFAGEASNNNGLSVASTPHLLPDSPILGGTLQSGVNDGPDTISIILCLMLLV